MENFDPWDDKTPRSPLDDVADNTDSINQELWKIRQELVSIATVQAENQQRMLDEMQLMIARLSDIRDFTRNAMWILAFVVLVLAFK